MAQRPVILIAGPTASGKSGLALALAERLRGAVINADSMQVYRELRVLTARPSPEDEARVPHILYGHVPASDAYSAARFSADAEVAISRSRAEGRLPIVVGGTGLYFKALLEGLSPVPPVPEDIRRRWRREAERVSPAELHDVLASRDPVAAERLRPTDPQRVVRALEVLEATGQSLMEWQKTSGRPVLTLEEVLPFVVHVERSILHTRCDARFDVMMENGAIREAACLGDLGLDPGLPAMRALGVRALLDHLAGKVTREAAIVRAKAETRQYAKRQLTWRSGNMRAWNIVSTQDLECLVDKIMSFIDC